jgi:hypothetical protein
VPADVAALLAARPVLALERGDVGERLLVEQAPQRRHVRHRRGEVALDDLVGLEHRVDEDHSELPARADGGEHGVAVLRQLFGEHAIGEALLAQLLQQQGAAERALVAQRLRGQALRLEHAVERGALVARVLGRFGAALLDRRVEIRRRHLDLLVRARLLERAQVGALPHEAIALVVVGGAQQQHAEVDHRHVDALDAQGGTDRQLVGIGDQLRGLALFLHPQLHHLAADLLVLAEAQCCAHDAFLRQLHGEVVEPLLLAAVAHGRELARFAAGGAQLPLQFLPELQHLVARGHQPLLLRRVARQHDVDDLFDRLAAAVAATQMERHLQRQVGACHRRRDPGPFHALGVDVLHGRVRADQAVARDDLRRLLGNGEEQGERQAEQRAHGGAAR